MEDGLFRSCETTISIRWQHKLDISVLEISANDLIELAPEVIGSVIKDLVCLLHKTYGVKIMAVSANIHRRVRRVQSVRFNHNVDVLNHYLRVVLEKLDFAFFFRHRGLQNPSAEVLSFELQGAIFVTEDMVGT